MRFKKLPVERITIQRRVVQAVFFAVSGQWLFTGFLRCPFGVPFINCTACPLHDCTGTVLQVPFLILLVGLGVVVGRAFCGWVCPLGLLQDVLGKLPHPDIESSAWFQRAEPFLRAVKYVVLVLLLFMILFFNFPAERPYPYVVRTPTVFNVESLRLAMQLGALRYGIRIVLFGFALASALLVHRFWCRYLCPFGAAFAMFNKIGLLRIRQTPECRECGKCPGDCLQHTVAGAPDCIVCGDCVDYCPWDAVEISRRGRGPEKGEVGETLAPAGGDGASNG